MKLYTYYRSSAAYRVRIALNLKGLDYEAVPVHLARDGGEHRRPEYRAKNPQGLVPTLETATGKTLAQSLAIMEYLDEVYPQQPLLPKDAEHRALVRGWAQIVACDIHPLNNLRVLKYLGDEMGAPAEKIKTDWYHHWLNAGFSALEKSLTQSALSGDFCFGNTPGLADCCLIPQIYNAERFKLDMSAYPLLKTINHNCLQLDAFYQAAPEQQADAE